LTLPDLTTNPLLSGGALARGFDGLLHRFLEPGKARGDPGRFHLRAGAGRTPGTLQHPFRLRRDEPHLVAARDLLERVQRQARLDRVRPGRRARHIPARAAHHLFHGAVDPGTDVDFRHAFVVYRDVRLERGDPRRGLESSRHARRVEELRVDLALRGVARILLRKQRADLGRRLVGHLQGLRRGMRGDAHGNARQCNRKRSGPTTNRPKRGRTDMRHRHYGLPIREIAGDSMDCGRLARRESTAKDATEHGLCQIFWNA
jgi:hypothetical protein